jgi:hypothetical protein
MQIGIGIEAANQHEGSAPGCLDGLQSWMVQDGL